MPAKPSRASTANTATPPTVAPVLRERLLDLLSNGLLGVALGVILLGGVGRLAVILLGVVGRSVLVHGVHGPVAGHFCVRVDCDVAVVGAKPQPVKILPSTAGAWMPAA